MAATYCICEVRSDVALIITIRRAASSKLYGAEQTGHIGAQRRLWPNYTPAQSTAVTYCNSEVKSDVLLLIMV